MANTASRRSRFRLTLEGLGWLMLTGLLLYQGWLRSLNLVALTASFLFGLWLLNFIIVFLQFRLKRIDVQRRIVEPVFAGKPFIVQVHLANATRDRHLALRVVDRGPSHQEAWLIPRLGRDESHHSFHVTVPKRGDYVFAPLAVSTGYPFGLFRRSVIIDLGDEVTVLPRLGRLNTGTLRRMLLQEPRFSASTKRPMLRHPGAQTEFYGLREFRAGDSPRWIHWRTTARVGELMVREFEEPPVDHLVLVLDPWLPHPPAALTERWQEVARDNERRLVALRRRAPEGSAAFLRGKQSLEEQELPFRGPLDRLELGISLCATICATWCKHPGTQLALAIAGNAPRLMVTETSTKHMFPLLAALARVEGGPEEGWNDLLKQLTTTHLPPGPVILVTPRGQSFQEELTSRLRRPVLTLDMNQPVIAELVRLNGPEVE